MTRRSFTVEAAHDRADIQLSNDATSFLDRFDADFDGLPLEHRIWLLLQFQQIRDRMTNIQQIAGDLAANMQTTIKVPFPSEDDERQHNITNPKPANSGASRPGPRLVE